MWAVYPLYISALILEFVMQAFHDVPAGPAEAAERLWYPSPPSTGLVASAGAVERKKKREGDSV